MYDSRSSRDTTRDSDLRLAINCSWATYFVVASLVASSLTRKFCKKSSMAARSSRKS